MTAGETWDGWKQKTGETPVTQRRTWNKTVPQVWRRACPRTSNTYRRLPKKDYRAATPIIITAIKIAKIRKSLEYSSTVKKTSELLSFISATSFSKSPKKQLKDKYEDLAFPKSQGSRGNFVFQFRDDHYVIVRAAISQSKKENTTA